MGIAVYYGAPPTTVTDIDQDEVTGRIAFLYAFDNGISPYLNYSESFEPTTGVDSVTGKAFEPTTADQVEAGVKYQPQVPV